MLSPLQPGVCNITLTNAGFSNITLRMEAFNLLNHPNYAAPCLNISNTTTVGTMTSVVRPIRFDF